MSRSRRCKVLFRCYAQQRLHSFRDVDLAEQARRRKFGVAAPPSSSRNPTPTTGAQTRPFRGSQRTTPRLIAGLGFRPKTYAVRNLFRPRDPRSNAPICRRVVRPASVEAGIADIEFLLVRWRSKGRSASTKSSTTDFDVAGFRIHPVDVFFFSCSGSALRPHKAARCRRRDREETRSKPSQRQRVVRRVQVSCFVELVGDDGESAPSSSGQG